MAKLALIPVLFAIACLLAGGYGAIHNQISYTVSPEYFTRFKFEQFHIADQIPERLGAAIVGWNAAWWMGLLIGVVLIPLGLVIRGRRDYFWGMVMVFGIVTLTALVVGLAALALATALLNPSLVGDLHYYGHEIDDDLAFARAGTMHNFSYLGGMTGIFTGALGIAWLRIRQRRRSNQSHDPNP